jgi:alpha-L-fucosidase 2
MNKFNSFVWTGNKNANELMIKSLFFLVVILNDVYLFAQAGQQITFDAPATHFTQSLPLGNGRLGAMVFGNVNRERIVLNENSMWSGGVQDPNRHDAHEYLSSIRQLLKQEKNREAQELLQQHFISAGKGSGNGNGAHTKFGCYQVLADLFITWKDTAAPVTGYKRTLHIDKALAITEWKRNNIKYKEEVWVSAPQQVIIIRLTTGNDRALDFDLSLKRKERARFSSAGNSIIMQGQLDGGDGEPGIDFAAYASALVPEGKVHSTNNGLTISGSNECLIIIGADTNLNWPNVEKRGTDPLPVAQKQVVIASKITAAVLLENHIKNYQSLFNRCEIKFTATENDSIKMMTTPQRLMRYAAGGSDVNLPVLYFNFGRYLLISSSRPGGLPANLQGLWAEEYQTPWNGDYHLNINLQMNYWPAEITNLADCHQPLIDFTQQLVKPGMKTAQAYYNADGWVAHVISNPWKFTAPGEGAEWGSTLTGGAWLCQHLWQHYIFNPDKNFLQKIYPVLKGATQFYTSILIEDPKTKWLVTAPSNSPENTYITATGFAGQTTMGPAMDMQIGRELLSNTIAAASILNVDKTWCDSLQKIKKRLAPNQISPSTGGIQEWIRDYEEADMHHRHVSNLYGLHPYDEINNIDAPALAGAAKKTLLRRGDAGTGWSRAWKINFWARLNDGNHALKMLKALLQPAFTLHDKNYKMIGAGTYPNLFCAHPPFQIDGNFGATAAIAEMLLQSTGTNSVIRFLPALPTAVEWSSGTAKGLCARNGFEINFSWDESKLSNSIIFSKNGYPCYVQLPQGMNVFNGKGEKIKVKKLTNNIVMFETSKSGKYVLK